MGSSLSILAAVDENESWVVLDKPALLDSQNSKPGRESVVDWLARRFGFSGLVHRLDFGTSGLMVCAKTPSAAKTLTEALKNGRIARGYLAVVLGGSAEGKTLPDKGALDSALEGKEALTRFRVIRRFVNATLVEIDLETGRKHQIRRHFADAGFPLLGDRLYGKKGSALLFERPALHAFRLVVMGKEYKSPLPADIEKLLQRLRPKV